jgi:spore maturation protein CgeB
MLADTTGRIAVMKARSGVHTLRVQNEDGIFKTLHSLYDPEAESRSMVDAFSCEESGIIVVLGLGLGYHVAELTRRYPSSKIVVIEPIPDMIELARNNGPALGDDISFITGSCYEDTLKKIARLQVDQGVAPLSVFPLSSAVSLFPSFYRPILTALKKSESVKLWDKLRYRKFQTERRTVLLIDSGYFLLSEAEKALESLGHRVVKTAVHEKDSGDRLIARFIEAIITFKPDFILTVNHLGLDEEGRIAEFLKSIELPVASWYVDSPSLIVRAFDANITPYVSLFLWDKSYMSEMESFGFESVHYLPLGTDEKLFRPLKARKHRKKIDPYRCDISFLGNSMTEAVRKYNGKVHPDLHEAICRTAERISASGVPPQSVDAFVSDGDRTSFEGLSSREKMDFEAGVIWQATLNYRLACIRSFNGHAVRIHGDRGWTELTEDSSVDLKEPLHYYREAPLLYNATKINFNATSLQMRSAVNQRVFDVPACGAFILTDYRDSLHELFDVGREIIAYESIEEIPEKAGYYLSHDEERRAIAEKGRERVIRDHTYRRRMESLISEMEKKYA